MTVPSAPGHFLCWCTAVVTHWEPSSIAKWTRSSSNAAASLPFQRFRQFWEAHGRRVLCHTNVFNFCTSRIHPVPGEELPTNFHHLLTRLHRELDWSHITLHKSHLVWRAGRKSKVTSRSQITRIIIFLKNSLEAPANPVRACERQSVTIWECDSEGTENTKRLVT